MRKSRACICNCWFSWGKKTSVMVRRNQRWVILYQSQSSGIIIYLLSWFHATSTFAAGPDSSHDREAACQDEMHAAVQHLTKRSRTDTQKRDQLSDRQRCLYRRKNKLPVRLTVSCVFVNPLQLHLDCDAEKLKNAVWWAESFDPSSLSVRCLVHDEISSGSNTRIWCGPN